jgi:hypothetical protein
MRIFYAIHGGGVSRGRTSVEEDMYKGMATNSCMNMTIKECLPTWGFGIVGAVNGCGQSKSRKGRLKPATDALKLLYNLILRCDPRVRFKRMSVRTSNLMYTHCCIVALIETLEMKFICSVGESRGCLSDPHSSFAYLAGPPNTSDLGYPSWTNELAVKFAWVVTREMPCRDQGV